MVPISGGWAFYVQVDDHELFLNAYTWRLQGNAGLGAFWPFSKVPTFHFPQSGVPAPPC